MKTNSILNGAVLLCATGHCSRQVEDYRKFVDFTARYGKSYASKALHESKFETFRANLAKIEEHNEKSGNDFELGINGFSDLTEDEFVEQVGMTAQVDHPLLETDRPHHNDRSKRYEGDKEGFAVEGFDLNNYKWLDR